MNQEKSKIRIDVVSDVACPWCYIGKRRIEQAIENTQISDNVQIIYHPFQLDPLFPTKGLTLIHTQKIALGMAIYKNLHKSKMLVNQ
jgi:predicted DsbA family dithiol-disulfide isomerase